MKLRSIFASAAGSSGGNSTTRIAVPLSGGDNPIFLVALSSLNENPGGEVSVIHRLAAGLPEPPGLSVSRPSNSATALLLASSPVTTRRTSAALATEHASVIAAIDKIVLRIMVSSRFVVDHDSLTTIGGVDKALPFRAGAIRSPRWRRKRNSAGSASPRSEGKLRRADGFARVRPCSDSRLFIASHETTQWGQQRTSRRWSGWRCTVNLPIPQGPGVLSFLSIIAPGNRSGGQHETSPPTISPSDSGYCRAAARVAHRKGAGLSDTAGAGNRAIRAGGSDRHHSTLDWPMAIGAAQPAIRHQI